MEHSIEDLAFMRASHYLSEVKMGTFSSFDLQTLTRLVTCDVEQIVGLNVYSEPVGDEERSEIAVACDRALNEGW